MSGSIYYEDKENMRANELGCWEALSPEAMKHGRGEKGKRSIGDYRIGGAGKLEG